MTQANAFDWLETFGGTAAPMFFLLAGVALGIAEGFREDRYSSFQRRFLHVICVGYALKLWSYVIDRVGFLQPREWIGIGLCTGVVFLFHHGLEAAPHTTFTVGRFTYLRRNALFWATVLLVALLVWCGNYEAFRRRYGQLDVLQQMAVALIATNFLARQVYRNFSARSLIRLAIGGALLICVLSQPMHDFPGTWPRSITHWLVRKTGESMPYFPLFPWAAYTFIGLAIGLWIRMDSVANVSDFALPHRVPAVSALAAGATGISLFLERSPFFVALSSPWFWHISRLCFYVSFLIFVAGTLAWLAARIPSMVRALESVGQRSLLIYGVHLEFVFGLLGKPLYRELSPRLYFAASAILMMMMYTLAAFWTRRASMRKKTPS